MCDPSCPGLEFIMPGYAIGAVLLVAILAVAGWGFVKWAADRQLPASWPFRVGMMAGVLVVVGAVVLWAILAIAHNLQDL
jgi:uncharacterized membrane protein YidH (DUF202 family)